MQSKPKNELIRIVSSEDGTCLSIDRSGRAPGRGVYLCCDITCFDAARKKRALGRSLKETGIGSDQYDVFRQDFEQYLEDAEKGDI